MLVSSFFIFFRKCTTSLNHSPRPLSIIVRVALRIGVRTSAFHYEVRSTRYVLTIILLYVRGI